MLFTFTSRAMKKRRSHVRRNSRAHETLVHVHDYGWMWKQQQVSRML